MNCGNTSTYNKNGNEFIALIAQTPPEACSTHRVCGLTGQRCRWYHSTRVTSIVASQLVCVLIMTATKRATIIVSTILMLQSPKVQNAMLRLLSLPLISVVECQPHTQCAPVVKADKLNFTAPHRNQRQAGNNQYGRGVHVPTGVAGSLRAMSGFQN